MLEDFNYQQFNQQVLPTIKEEYENDIDNDKESRSNSEEEDQDERETHVLTRQLSKASLSKDDIVEILNSQQVDDLLDLTRLKITVRSEFSDNNVKFIYIYRICLSLIIYKHYAQRFIICPIYVVYQG